MSPKRKETSPANATPVTNLVELALTRPEPEWGDINEICTRLSIRGQIIINTIELKKQSTTTEPVLAFDIEIRHPDTSMCRVIHHIGLGDDFTYTGYNLEGLTDKYRITTPDGGLYVAEVWQPSSGGGPLADPIAHVWQLVQPLRSRINTAVLCRALKFYLAKQGVITDTGQDIIDPPRTPPITLA